jgi:hypothetical protein
MRQGAKGTVFNLNIGQVSAFRYGWESRQRHSMALQFPVKWRRASPENYSCPYVPEDFAPLYPPTDDIMQGSRRVYS